MTRAIGIDISRYNISFDPTRATGAIDFVIQKATEATAYVDLEYDNLWQGVKQIGVRGAYHYLRSGMSWVAQAEHFLRTAERHDYHLYALDLEEVNNEYSDTFFADAKRIIDLWRAASGKKVVLYTNGSTYNQFYLSMLKLYGEAGALWLDGTSLWIASPATAGAPFLPKYRTNKDWLIHQYSWTGFPARWGTGGTRVDENVFCGDIDTFRSYFHLSDEPPTQPEPEEIIMERYKATNLYANMSLRGGHDTAASFVRSYPAGTVWYGNETWTAPEDKFIENGTQINKAGDVWLHVTRVGSALADGWVAITHLGREYCRLTDYGTTEPPAEVRPTELTITLSDGSKWRASEFTKVG